MEFSDWAVVVSHMVFVVFVCSTLVYIGYRNWYDTDADYKYRVRYRNETTNKVVIEERKLLENSKNGKTKWVSTGRQKIIAYSKYTELWKQGRIL